MKEKIIERLKELEFDYDNYTGVISLYDDNEDQLSDLFAFIQNPDLNGESRDIIFKFAFSQNPDALEPIEVIDDDEFDRLVKEGVIDEDGNPIEADE